MSADDLIRLGRAYARCRGLALSTVGRLAGGQGSFFQRVAARRVTIRRVDRAIQWFSDHWPAELAWPEDLPRPEPRPGSPAASAAENDMMDVQAVRAALDLARARVEAGDLDGARKAEEAAFEAGSRLRPDGRIASVPALCDALNLSRDVYYDVVRRFAGRRGIGRRTRSGSASDRMLRALTRAGDTRFALFRTRLRDMRSNDHDTDAAPSPRVRTIEGAGPSDAPDSPSRTADNLADGR